MGLLIGQVKKDKKDNRVQRSKGHLPHSELLID